MLGSRPLLVLLGLTVACGPGQAVDPTSSTGSTSTPNPDTTSDGTSQGDAPPQTSSTSLPPPPDSTGTTGSETGVFPEQCSVWNQDCPPGYKCMPWANDGGGSWNDTKCVEIVEDPGHVGDPCTVVGTGLSGEDDCDGTTMCWDVNPATMQGVCTELCTGSEEDPHCTQTCDVCILTADGLFDFCQPTCDPLGDDCAPDQVCTELYQGFFCIAAWGGEPAGTFEPCEYYNECAAGLVCLSSTQVPGCTSPGCCTPVCSLEGLDSCPDQIPGTTCQPWWSGDDEPDPSCPTASVGLCQG